MKIRCGGDALTLQSGETWGRTRFFLGGHPWNAGEVDVHGTELDDLYRKAQAFYSWDPPDVQACVIPVPPARYRVRLHFAETAGNYPGERRVDVWLQGQVVLRDFEILAEVPFRTALVKEIETRFENGALELRFSMGPGPYGALISGIEVERLE